MFTPIKTHHSALIEHKMNALAETLVTEILNDRSI